MGDVCTNHFFYADDICLLAPSSSAMQQLLNVCASYGERHDIIFNPLKSLFLVFYPRRFNACMSDVFLGASSLPVVTQAKYLGVLLNSSQCDNTEIAKQYSLLYARCNTILRKFKHCSFDVKRQLFTSYCTNFYCMPLWNNFTQCTLKKAKVAYNNVFRMLFNYDRRSSASLMFVTHNVPGFDALLRKCIFSFHSRLHFSHNSILNVLFSHPHALFNRILLRWRDVLHVH